MKFAATIFFLMIISPAFSQEANNLIKAGNEAYAKGDFSAASAYYQKAIDKAPQNDTAKFNLGNALQKQNKADDAQKYYDEIASDTKDKTLGENAFYNKGVSLAKDKKLPEAADAFKQSLRMLPADDSARENLQKVLNEMKQQQQKNKPQQQPKNQQQQQKQDKTQLSKQRAEQLLSNLREQEKELQKKLQQQKTSPNQPDKDW